jgi:hypothetical protein
MASWKIEPTFKKSLIERLHYTKGDKEIIVETGWRWGQFTCETEDDEPPLIEEGDDLYDSGYDIILEYTDDGCWEEVTFKGFTEEEEEEMREWLYDNSAFELENDGWNNDTNEMIMNCEASIELISPTSACESEAEEVDPKKKWPF